MSDQLKSSISSPKEERAWQHRERPAPANSQDSEWSCSEEAAALPDWLVASSADAPVDSHMALLRDRRLSHDANGIQRARLVDRLQRAYGNAYVQRLIDLKNEGEGANARPIEVMRVREEPGRPSISHAPASSLQRRRAANTGRVRVNGPTTSYYNVTGNTLADVATALGTQEWGRCNWNFSYTYRTDANSVVTRADVTLTLTIRLPRWTGRGWNRASRAAKAEWRRMVGCLRTHENGHASRARRWATTLQQRLLNQQEADVAGRWNQGMAEHEAEQQQYDASTSHGQTQGVSLDTSIT